MKVIYHKPIIEMILDSRYKADMMNKRIKEILLTESEMDELYHTMPDLMEKPYTSLFEFKKAIANNNVILYGITLGAE